MSSSGVAISQIRSESAISSGHLTDQSELIMIFVAVSGSMIPLRVFESDSVETIKFRLQRHNGFVVKNQKLVCSGRELARSNSLVRDYGVTDGNIIHLVLRLSDLQVINVKTSSGKEFTFHVERSRDVGYVKRKISRKKKSSRLVDSDEEEVITTSNGEQLEDGRLINDICKSNDAVVHLFVGKSAKIRSKPVDKHFELSIVAPQIKVNSIVVPDKPPDRDILLEPVIVNPKIEVPFVISEMIDSTTKGLEMGNYPIKTAEGTGGAYFIPDESGNNYVSVFKPIDEEPMAVNNPGSLPISIDGEGLKKGTRVGEGALREAAAYILDHCHKKDGLESIGFSGVPPTTIVKCLHRGFHHPDGIRVKIGSLQMFMENQGSCEDIGPGSFPVQEVHKISVLDIRMANADRHAGNILLQKDKSGQTRLIPIDHGYCLPDSFEDCTFEWLYWPQAKHAYNQETLEYIESLDAEADIALLKLHGWDMPIETARTLRISTMLLKKGAERGMTPFAIGNIMCRASLKKESILEEIVQEAMDSVLPGSSEDSFVEAVSHVMDRRLNEKKNGK
ncbi:phosphatidylinositol 4-kinase gamma 4-like [Impatiens glandulifera]|uniref:phosphatidylinositol 4-kinase gamma 4-like n=1 Tax=Impatiens glandulifera TaxID=253017 RepID=UPI001FB15B57|nr:phosphatidylinositol 4-kinase gamma 4-like [Impatiens glandulifera]